MTPRKPPVLVPPWYVHCESADDHDHRSLSSSGAPTNTEPKPCPPKSQGTPAVSVQMEWSRRAPGQLSVVGASDFFIDVTSGSGNQYSLLLRISGASATLTKQNPDGSVTIFKGRAPDQLGMIRLDGIQASNRGAFILGQFPYNREPGKNFKLQANQFANGDQVWDCTFR